MLEKIIIFVSFNKIEKHSINPVEWHIILHALIEERETNNFCSTSTSRNCSVEMVEVSQVVSS